MRWLVTYTLDVYDEPVRTENEEFKERGEAEAFFNEVQEWDDVLAAELLVIREAKYVD